MNKVELNKDLEYLTEKRNDNIDHFSEKLKCYGLYSEDELRQSFETVLRTCKQLKMVEDAMIIYRITKEKNELH